MSKSDFGSVVSVSAQEAHRILDKQVQSHRFPHPELARSILNQGFLHQFDADAVANLERVIGELIEQQSALGASS